MDIQMLNTYLTVSAYTTTELRIWRPSTVNIEEDLEYSVNGGDWVNIWGYPNKGRKVALSLNEGDTVRLRGNMPATSIESAYASTDGKYSIRTENGAYVYGNVMSVLYGDDFASHFDLENPYALCSLFVEPGTAEGNLIENHPTYDIVLPATSITEACYRGMFSTCKKITRMPELPTFEVPDWAYYGMFSGCVSLTAVTPLTGSVKSGGEYPTAYSNMFYGCSSLVESPIITSPFIGNCTSMFRGCSSLSKITILSEQYNDTRWMTSGVSETGIFVKAKGVEWPTGPDGIPSGWAVQEYEEEISPKIIRLDCPEGSTYFDIYLTSGWTITNYSSWLNLSTTAGTGSQRVYFDYEQNESSEPRFGQIIVNDGLLNHTVTVAQGAYYTVDASDINSVPFSMKMMDVQGGHITVSNGNAMTSNQSNLSLVYSINNGPWENATFVGGYATLNLDYGDTVRLKAYQNNRIWGDCFGGWITASTEVQIYGNLNSLLRINGFEDMDEIVGNITFFRLFHPNMTYYKYQYNIKNHPTYDIVLPSKVRGFYEPRTWQCKQYMELFSRTGIERAPYLPTTNLSNERETQEIYSGMFYECTALTQAMEVLPATKIGKNSQYARMFAGCTSLQKAPKILVEEVNGGTSGGAFNGMFSGCTSLNEIEAHFLWDPKDYSGYTVEWVTAVSETGTFIQSNDADWFTFGTYAIPEGWKVLDQDGTEIVVGSMNINEGVNNWILKVPTDLNAIKINNTTYRKNKNKCGEYAIYYKNRLGGFDGFLFEGVCKKISKIERLTYRNKNTGTIDYRNVITYSWELNTHRMTDDEVKRFDENILPSKTVYLHCLSTDEVIPVNIDDNTIEIRGYKSNGNRMVVITLNVSSSQELVDIY